ncbi:uncharacterized protein SAPINGB_P006105 [Magnusiomyces paraingens]|uniref:Glucose-induced degradation protein 4 n=1 Tax=Magnusiomyces paraingens TaxID=2606893 RepID=A0A5E8CAF5_9ASCO|nr:uncharacterized protein SAPINGB_P006105 [Saprochaete ingens]VVT58236.1 unnamed protein product [Saprochaete ingens]
MPRVNDGAGPDGLETINTTARNSPAAVEVTESAGILRIPVSPAQPLTDNAATQFNNNNNNNSNNNNHLQQSSFNNSAPSMSPGLSAAVSPNKMSSPGPPADTFTPITTTTICHCGETHATRVQCALPMAISITSSTDTQATELSVDTQVFLETRTTQSQGSSKSSSGGTNGFNEKLITTNNNNNNNNNNPVESSSKEASVSNKQSNNPQQDLSQDLSKPQQPPSTSSNNNTLLRPSLLDSVFHDPWYDRRIPLQTSSYLRPGAHFVGTQHSKRSSYEVSVVLKSVDMSTHFLCGYLRIRGLTENQSVMETYFEGEMVSPTISFYTRRPEWNQNDQVDRTHWNRFNAWRALAAKADKKIDADYVHNRFENQEHVFMRWKEFFLVPDYKVRNMEGASYEGFYYICFNQVDGSITGVYYHKNSEVYQQLDLSHAPDWGTYPYYEFR